MVPQNLAGLFHAMGGTARVTARLDRLFTRLNAGPTASYYWGGNEPGLEIPWEYTFADRPWRTQAVVRQIVTSLYNPTATGLPGNDDLGAMSCWYVWATIGLYPEIPGVPGLVIGSPLFPNITVYWGNGNRLRITAPDASPGRPYVRSLEVRGRPYTRTWLPLSGIMGPSTLSFELSGRSTTTWGSARADTPPSFVGS
jgi:putative alpha-1,2-mannosidase